MSGVDSKLLAKLQEIGRQLSRLNSRITTLERSPQMRFTSWTGQQAVYDDAGTVRQIVGAQPDGTYTITEQNAPAPPVPTVPVLQTGPGVIVVSWDGTFQNGDVPRPLDLAYVEVHVGTIPNFVKSDATQVTVFAGDKGGVYTIPSRFEDGTKYVALISVNNSRTESDPTTEVFAQGDPIVSIGVTSDGNVPTTAPTVFMRPLGYSGVMIQWNPISNPDPVSYRVYLDTVNPPVQHLVDTADVLVATSVEPDGTPLDPTVTYYARVVPYDEDGDGPPSAVVSGGPVVVPASAVAVDVMVVNELFSREGYFGTVSADKVESGELVAALAIVGGLAVGPGIMITADNGIEIVHQDTPRIASVLNQSGISLRADVVATALTVMGKFEMQGTDNDISTGAWLTVQAGITEPKQAPQMTSEYPTHRFHPGFSGRGMVKFPADSSTAYLETESAFADGVITRLDRTTTSGIDLSGAPFVAEDFLYGFGSWSIGADGGRGEVQTALGGVTVIGSEVYVLCQTTEAFPGTYRARWYVYQFHYTGGTGAARYSYIRRWLYEPNPTDGGGSIWDPQIGTDGTNLFIAQSNANNAWVVNRYGPSGAFLGRTILFEADGTTNFRYGRSCGGIVIGSIDGVANRWYIATASYPWVYAFNSSGIRVAADEFSAPMSPITGLHHDGTNFWMASSPASEARKFSRVTNVSGLSSVQTWRKADPTDTITAAVGDFAQFETKAGPPSNSLIQRRAFVRIQTPSDIPPAGGADALSFYVKSGAGTYHIVPPPAVGVQSQVLETLPTSGVAPPAATTFGSASPGLIRSFGLNVNGDPTWQHEGTGAGRSGQTAWDSDGHYSHGTFGSISVRRTTAQNITDGTWTVLIGNITDWASSPSNSLYTTASGFMRVTKAGLYHVDATCQFAANINNRRLMRIYRNDTTTVQTGELIDVFEGNPSITGSGVAPTAKVSGFVLCSANDYILPQAWQNSGGTLTIIANSYRVQIRKVG